MGNRSDKMTTQITLGANFKVSGTLKFVRVGQIEGYGKGSIRDEMVYPASHCLVAKSKSDPKKFRLLNHLDQRVHSMLMAYDSSSKVHCLVVDESEGAFPTESISFLSGEVFACQTSRKKLSDTFKEICNSKDKQDLVNRFVCTQAGHEGNTLGFNLTNFVEVVGQNSITKSTADTWLDSKLDSVIEVFAYHIDKQDRVDEQSLTLTDATTVNTADLKRLKRIGYYKNKAPFIKRLNPKKENISLDDPQKLGISEAQLVALIEALTNLKRARFLAEKWHQLNTQLDIQQLMNVIQKPTVFLDMLENLDQESPAALQDFFKALDRYRPKLAKTGTEGMTDELHS